MRAQNVSSELKPINYEACKHVCVPSMPVISVPATKRISRVTTTWYGMLAMDNLRSWELPPVRVPCTQRPWKTYGVSRCGVLALKQHAPSLHWPDAPHNPHPQAPPVKYSPSWCAVHNSVVPQPFASNNAASRHRTDQCYIAACRLALRPVCVLSVLGLGPLTLCAGSWVEALNAAGFSVCGIDNQGAGR